VLATLVGLAAVAAAVATAAGLGGGDATATTDDALPPSTAEITRQTLKDSLDADGELGYGPSATVASRRPGTVTWLPASGAQISRGHPLYKMDNEPAILLYGAMPAYRNLVPGTEGPDVAQLEQNLSALGYTGFTVDEEYTFSTASAVEQWQQDVGLPETGVVDLGRVVFAAGEVRIDSLSAEAGLPTAPGGKVLTYTGTAKVVTVDLEVSDQRLAKQGTAVSVTLPDGRRVPGKVTQVATVIEAGDGREEPQTKIEALVALDDPQAAADLGQAAVDVTFTSSEHPDVLTVPVAALVALKEGGFGVELVEGTASRHVAVTTGLFAGGRVEISGDGITAGAKVGMPK
jgi:peptidoglycan hydrolase-like protein with peptidoglycan-binding domain